MNPVIAWMVKNNLSIVPGKVRNIEIYMGPKELGVDDELLDTIISFIDGVKNGYSLQFRNWILQK